MYSDQVQDMLDDAGVTVGDTVRVATGTGEYEGRLMPQTAQGDPDTLVLKLDNGYNTGIGVDDDTAVELVSERGPVDESEADIPEHDPDKLDIAVLHTGGTIASKVSYEEGGVKPGFDPEDLLQLYPELFETANVESEVIAQMLSEDMEPAHWQEIAEAAAEHQDKDGIIIGHGTDTMQYTAAALTFMLQGIDIPVVLVGAQRSSDRPSSDAAVNLLSAVRFIEEDIPGVYVCMHAGTSDTAAAVHHGARVRKMHTSRRDAFQSIDTAPVAVVDTDEDSVTVRGDVSAPAEEFELQTSLATDVGLLKTRPGLGPDELDRFGDSSGLVIEGTGLGHMPVNAFDDHTQHHSDVLDTLEEIAADTVVVMASQCINGRVNMNVYDAGVKIQDAGVISAETMTPETAYVKLMWVLGQADTREEAVDLFQENVAGEIVEREEYDGFN